MPNVIKNITVIPATLNRHTGTPQTTAGKRKVAAYARVSTDSEEQLTSYEAQVDYYTKYIQGRSDWQFVAVYTDEGISALNTKKREGFNRMVSDALAGKIDLIVTKSVSRFARNTVDSLTTVRKLKEHGTEVYFEKEGIYTFDSKGELLITIMSSLAQEESRSISENVTWGQRKRFADGKVSIPYGQFLGYKKGADGLPEIVPEEAKIVTEIYRMFMEGKTTNAIAKRLTERGIPTPAGKETWMRQTVESILRNEKYKGAALLQKKYTVDFLQKKMKVNEGEVPQYYVEHSHPAIIEPREWDRVQLELERRRNDGRRTICGSPFAGKIICGDCGEIYGSKVWHSTSKYRRTILQCNAKFRNETKCRTPHLYEEDLKRHFITALSRLLADREALLEDSRLIRSELLATDAIDREIVAITQEADVLAGLVQNCVSENAARAVDQAAYIERYNNLVERYETIQVRLDALQKKKDRRKMQADAITGCLTALENLDILRLEFNEALWTAAIDHVTVYEDDRLVFRFKTGSDVAIPM
jgi:DNA invertase Pin-like site-specific DNA recombinase